MSKRSLSIGLGVLCVVLVSWCVVVVRFSWQAVSELRQSQFSSASRDARIASFFFSPVEKSLGKINGDVALWADSLRLISLSSDVVSQLQIYLPTTLAADPAAAEQATEISRQLPQLESTLQSWLTNYKRATLIPKVLSQHIHSELFTQLITNSDQVLRVMHRAVLASQYLLTNDHRLIVLLQNSDELRATGGFMGSYASLELSNGVVRKLEIQDIYVPDGQFAGYVDPPPGAAEYLSGGKGFRLPDSNWSPDFPVSAQQVMQFFALGKENQVESVIAVNLGVAEELMKLTGPIYLPDYSQTVTADNLSTLARADRSQFFPGSQQKRQFLQALFTQLKLQLGEAAQQHPDQFIETLIRQAQHKEIQAYGRSDELQNLFSELGLTGQVKTLGIPTYFFLVESNVGINKANRLVTRQVSMNLSPEHSLLQLHFSNQNPITTLKEERGEYINYQRLLVPKNFTLDALVINGQPVTTWDEQPLTTTIGEELKQIGFLVTVPAKGESTVELNFSHPSTPLSSLVLQKQSGISTTPYHIQTPTKTYDLLLEQDTLLNLD